MKQAIFENLVAYYVEQRFKGMDFSQIRTELTEKGVEPSMINRLIKAIDNQELNKVETKGNRQKGLEFIFFGIIIALIAAYLFWYNSQIEVGQEELFPLAVYFGFTLSLPMILRGIYKIRQKPDPYKNYPSIKAKATSERDINYDSQQSFWIE